MRSLVLLAALVLAVPAAGRSATPPAELFVLAYDTAPGATAETDVDLSLNVAADVVTETVPAGYRLDLSDSPGTVVGSAIVRAPEPVSASLLAADPASFAANGCAVGRHSAVWTAGALTVFVDPMGNTYRLTFCPPEQTVDVDLDLQGVLNNPAVPGTTTWRAFVTAGRNTIETRSAVCIPQTLGLRAAYLARTSRLALRGRLLSAGTPRRGVTVRFALATRADLRDARDFGAARTRADGTYALTLPFARTRVRQRLTLIAYVNFYAGACAEPSAGCVAQSIAPPPAELVSLTIPGR